MSKGKKAKEKMMKQCLFSYILVSCIVFVTAQVNRKLAGDVLLLNQNEAEKYAVIFDAGSTGSRVHVFRFDQNLDLLKIGQDYEYYEAIKPGLSAYAADPDAAAESLRPLLEKAEAIIPVDHRSTTPLKLGATAGLRLLNGSASEQILQAVRVLFLNESSLNSKPEWVGVLEGSQEGSYFWVAINYLLETTGKPYWETVATLDLGGGSVQMTYAVPKPSDISTGNENYVQQLYIEGATYNIYAHSYLNYGLLAARAEILKVSNNLSHPCIPSGYQGYYTYNSKVYKASALPSGSSYKKCKPFVTKALNTDAPCEHETCTFNGVWNGGGGAGQKNLYVASFFFEKASEVGLINSTKPSSSARPVDFRSAAKRTCGKTFQNLITEYPEVEDHQMICMDMVYLYTLLVDGFGLNPFQKITVLSKINYKGSMIGAAWPLGSAINAVSSLKFSSSEI